jgi:hypothetical protein
MHIGGDGELQNCDFEVELIDFLKQLERKHGAELIINGDAFGRSCWSRASSPCYYSSH